MPLAISSGVPGKRLTRCLTYKYARLQPPLGYKPSQTALPNPRLSRRLKTNTHPTRCYKKQYQCPNLGHDAGLPLQHHFLPLMLLVPYATVTRHVIPNPLLT